MDIQNILKKKLNNIISSHFIKNFTIVMSGTVLAQAFGFALSPVISRFYSPADFGVFGSFNSLVRIVTAGATLEYSQALILPKKNEDAFSLFIISSASTVLITIVFILIFCISPGYFKGILQTPSSWVLVPVLSAILVSGFNQTFQAWCVRIKSFKHTSASQVVRSLSANGIHTGMGFFHGGAPALMWGSIIADFLATLNLARATMNDFKRLIKKISLRKMLGIAKEYRDFPMYSATMNVMDALSNGLPIFLLTHYYGIAVAGSYAFGMRILSMPMEFILRALRQVLYQKATETFNNGQKLTPLYFKITGGLFALALVPSLVFVIWSPQIFGWVFGAEWVTAGEFARALVVWLVFMFCNLPATLFARIIRVQRKLFIFDLILLVARASVLVLGGIFLTAAWTIMIFALVGAAINVLIIGAIGFLLAKKERVSGLNGFMNTIQENS